MTQELKSFIPHDLAGTPGKFIATTFMEEHLVVSRVEFSENDGESITLYECKKYRIWDEDYFQIYGFKGDQAFMAALTNIHRETLLVAKDYIGKRK